METHEISLNSLTLFEGLQSIYLNKLLLKKISDGETSLKIVCEGGDFTEGEYAIIVALKLMIEETLSVELSISYGNQSTFLGLLGDKECPGINYVLIEKEDLSVDLWEYVIFGDESLKSAFRDITEDSSLLERVRRGEANILFCSEKKIYSDFFSLLKSFKDRLEKDIIEVSLEINVRDSRNVIIRKSPMS